MMIYMCAIVLCVAMQALHGVRTSRGNAPQKLSKSGARGSISSGISCDWSGDRRMNGGGANDDYFWRCQSGSLTLVQTAGTSLVAIEQEDAEAAAAGSLQCNWNGDRKFAGLNNCDDIVFGCYGNKLYSVMMVGHLYATAICSNYGCPAPASGSAVSCNFDSPKRFNGVSSNDDFYFVCKQGQLTAVNKAEPGAALVEAEEASDEIVQESASSQTCITWGTAEGRWDFVYSLNQPFSRTVTFGTQSSDTTKLTQEWASSLTASVSSGVTFAKKSVSLQLSYSIATETSSTYTQSYSVSTTAGCPYGGLYRWVMTNGRAWEPSSQYGTTVYSEIFWCTLDADAPPQCPPGACDCDGSPTECSCQSCKSFEGPHNNVSYTLPICDWSGSRRTSGLNSLDDYYLRCDDGRLTSITTAVGLAAANMQGCSGCDWSGPRHFAGVSYTDDLYLHCCGTSGNLLGIHASDGLSPQTPGSYNNGIPCQWAGTMRVNGIHSNDDFYMKCVNGLLEEVNAIPDR